MLFQRAVKDTSAGKCFFSRSDTIFSVVDRDCKSIFLKPNAFYFVKVNKERTGKEGQLFYIIEPIYKIPNILYWEEEEVKDRIPLGIWLARFLSNQVQEDKYLYRLIQAWLRTDKGVFVPGLQEKFEEMCTRKEPLGCSEFMELMQLLRPVQREILENEAMAMSAIFSLEQPQSTYKKPFEAISMKRDSEELLLNFEHKVKIRYYNGEEKEVPVSYAYGDQKKLEMKKIVDSNVLLDSII